MSKSLRHYGPEYFKYRAQIIKWIIYDKIVVNEFFKYCGRAKLITRELLLSFLSQKKFTPSARYYRLRILRAFCWYMHQIDQRHFIPGDRFLRKPKSKFKPHIFTKDEVIQMMSYARNKLWKGPQRLVVPAVYETVIGLMWATGMRIREVVDLNLGDIDFNRNCLIIRKTKFYKSRLIPLHPSTLFALQKYIDERNSFNFPKRPDCPLFFNWRMRGTKRGRYTVDAFHHKIHEIIVMLDIRGPTGKFARPYDLRHSFATNKFAEIYDGKDAVLRLPLIATYMGHAKLSYTQTYLHPKTETLAKLGKNFLAYFEGAI